MHPIKSKEGPEPEQKPWSELIQKIQDELNGSDSDKITKAKAMLKTLTEQVSFDKDLAQNRGQKEIYARLNKVLPQLENLDLSSSHTVKDLDDIKDILDPNFKKMINDTKADLTKIDDLIAALLASNEDQTISEDRRTVLQNTYIMVCDAEELMKGGDKNGAIQELKKAHDALGPGPD